MYNFYDNCSYNLRRPNFYIFDGTWTNQLMNLQHPLPSGHSLYQPSVVVVFHRMPADPEIFKETF